MEYVTIVLKNFSIVGEPTIYRVPPKHEIVKKLEQWLIDYPDAQPGITVQEIEQAASEILDAEFDLELSGGEFFARSF